MDAPIACVISHDPEMRHLIELNLQMRGVCTVKFPALEEPDTPLVQLQMVILDIDPSQGPDWETALTLRRNPWLKGVPLLLIAAALPAASQLAALEPVLWTRKPLAMDELLALLWKNVTDDCIPGDVSPSGSGSVLAGNLDQKRKDS